MPERKITCPRCKQHEDGFTAVLDIRVTVDIDAHGQQHDGADYANPGSRYPILLCTACGYGWQTRRYLDLAVDVR